MTLEHNDDVILVELRQIKESQFKTEKHLEILNGKVASHEKDLNILRGFIKGLGSIIGITTIIGAIIWVIQWSKKII